VQAEHFDVLIVGAGLSGVGAGRHLQDKCPAKTYAILEARDCIGGTWDLFRYPGVRSDSDMYTLGYAFRPWREAKSIADGPSILNYVRETAREAGVDRKIRFNHRVVRAAWSSADARWTVEAERGPEKEAVRFTCGFLFMCSGYYDCGQGYTPDFPGAARFKGRIAHPQNWTPDIDTKAKRVIVIGSGATAVTLVPEIAKDAAHVVMLQRSPTYVVSRPAEDGMANWLRRHLSATLAHHIIRWRNVLFGMYMFRLCRTKPEMVKKFILDGVRKQLGPDYDIDTHFTPRYDPWDQRLCLVPDADLFEAIKQGRASVVTDHIETFTETGIKLRTGRELEADLIVTATGLNLMVLGGVDFTVEGRPVELAKTLNYKGIMYSDMPNIAAAVGYTNASWTLKCDLTCDYVCRLLAFMDKNGYAAATPRRTDPDIKEEPWINFSSGYIQRSIAKFPKQGSKKPWRLNQNYALDIMALRYGAIDDGALEFRRAPSRREPAMSGGAPLRAPAMAK
jgi:cation diffusion facilitator CzcD-associated flavoprotein CzcO